MKKPVIVRSESETRESGKTDSDNKRAANSASLSLQPTPKRPGAAEFGRSV
jgi:hypothetical protein